MPGIANAGDDEGFARCQAVGGILIPEADQQIAAQTNALPPDIEEQEVAREQQHQHRRDEQVHIGEEPVIAFIACHEL